MRYLKLVLLVLMAVATVGCASRQDAATSAASTEWRLKSLEESFLNFREEQRQLADKMDRDSAALNARLDSIEERLSQLSGARVVGAPGMDEPAEDVEWNSAELKPEDGQWVEGSKPGEPVVAESDAEKPWDTVPGAPAEIPEPTVVDRSKVPAKPEAQSSPAAKPKPVAPKQAAKPESASKAMYESALAKYNGNDFDTARTQFDNFLKKYPKSKLAPNAIYWKGETYYSQKDFTSAILTFKEVTGRFPKDPKAAASLLKIAMSYDKVGDKDNAIFYLRALIEDFPDSQPAKLGRKELKRLGG